LTQTPLLLRQISDTAQHRGTSNKYTHIPPTGTHHTHNAHLLQPPQHWIMESVRGSWIMERCDITVCHSKVLLDYCASFTSWMIKKTCVKHGRHLKQL